MKPTPLTLLAVAILSAAGISLQPATADSPKQLTYFTEDGVWLAKIDGTGAKRIAGGQAPDLSPDGTKLAYNTVQTDGQPANRKIAVYDIASGKTTVFKDIPSQNAMEPRWSPDGKALLFDYYVNNDRKIGLINADGTGFKEVPTGTPPKAYWSEAWAADGKSFFAQDMEKLYLLDLDGKVLKKWTLEKLIPHGGMSGDSRLDVSPDGKLLLLEADMDEKERKGWDGPPPAIWIVDLATEKATRVTAKSFYAWDCHWLNAPDTILCASRKGEEKGADQEDDSIYKISATGQGKDAKLLAKVGHGPSTSR